MGISTDSDFKWTAKGDWQTSVYRNLLSDHIKAGGTCEDQVGGEIVQKYIAAVKLAPDFRDLVAHFRFNDRDLHNVISIAISAGQEGEIPSSFIQDGFPRLLGCVLLEHKAAITTIMKMVWESEARHIEAARTLYNDAVEEEMFVRERAIIGRLNAISEATIKVGRQHYEIITRVNGPAAVNIDPEGKGLPSSNAPGGGCGCAPLVILGGILLSSGAVVCAVLSALIHSVVR